MDGKLFVSHASADKPVIDRLVTLLDVGCGIDHKSIFCTSGDATGIPNGTPNYIEAIRSEIDKTSLFLFVVSQNFLVSEFCLCELGAAWATQRSWHLLVLPPLTPDKVKNVLKVTQMGMINDAGDLADLRDAINQAFSLSPMPTKAWNKQVEQYVGEFQSFLAKIPPSSHVPRRDHQALSDKYQQAQGKILELEAEKQRLEKIIDELKQLKDKDEASEVPLNNLPEVEQFIELADRFQRALDGLSHPVVKALFYAQTNEMLRYRQLTYPDDIEFNREIDDAVDQGYLIDRGGEFDIDMDNKEIEDATADASVLSDFLSNCSDELESALRTHYGYTPDISNWKFWQATQAGKHESLTTQS